MKSLYVMLALGSLTAGTALALSRKTIPAVAAWVLATMLLVAAITGHR